MKIVTFGGGSGHHQLAKALKYIHKDKKFEVYFIVGTWDNGGSSKYIRIGEKVLPPGDIGNVYSAISNLEEKELKIIWDGRVNLTQKSKHTPRNLILTNAIKEYNKDWFKINNFLKKFLKIEDNFYVFPITQEPSTLVAVFEENSRLYFVEGEEEVDFYILKKGVEPKELYIKENLNVYPKEQIKDSDIILISPGSFYTSVYPHFLFEEVRGLIKNKRKILINNIFTQGNINEQLNKLYNALGEFEIIYNNKNLDEKIKEIYKKENKNFIEEEEILKFAQEKKLKIYGSDLIYEKDLGKHDPLKLCNLLKNIL
jgi:uncharacterized cofD-like protein